MVTRTRTRSLYGPSGVAYYKSTIVGEPKVEILYWKCEDSFRKARRADGTIPPSDLTIQKVDRSDFGVINGAAGFYRWENLPYSTSNFVLPPSGTWEEIEGTTAELKARLLANSNPFRYEVSVPIMISELVEATTLLKVSTKTFASLFGSSWLNYNFGWATLVSDLLTLGDILKAVERRINEFNSLIQKGGLRRKINLASGTRETVQVNQPFQTALAVSVYGDVFNTYHSKVWGTVRWRPKRKDLIPTDKLSQFNMALRSVLDLGKVDAATVWEAIPFSWLVDYFVNVGDVLQALENSDLVEPYDICIMRHRKITTKRVPYTYSNRTATVGFARAEYKIRSVQTGGTTDLLSFGIMTKYQASLLLALLASAKKR